MPSFAIMHFTGCPASHLSSDDAKFFQGNEGWVEDPDRIEEFWSIIKESNKKGDSLMGTAKSCISEAFNQKTSEKGIISS